MSFIRRKTDNKGAFRYYPFYTSNGREVSLGGFSRKKDAEARLAREIAERASGKKEDLLFSEFAERWLTDVAAVTVKPSTLMDYRRIVEKQLVPVFGNHQLSEITPAMVQRFVAMASKGRAPGRVNKFLVVLRSMLKRAEIWGYLAKNPASHVLPVRTVKREMEFLTPQEVEKLLEEPGLCRALFAAAVMTGAREGELLALRWSDVDNCKFNIRRSYSPVHGFSEPKNDSRRQISFPPALLDYLEPGKARDLVFHNEDGKPWDGTYVLRWQLHPALKRAGIRQVRFHDLRHTYAALMISLNVNPKWLQVQMGHKNLTTTMDTYGHLYPSVEQDAPQRLEGLIFGEPRKHDGNGEADGEGG